MSSDEAAELSGSAELTEATATTAASCQVNGVKFNNKIYDDWGEPLVALRLLVNKSENDSPDRAQARSCQIAKSAWRCTAVWSKFGRIFLSFAMLQCACSLRMPPAQHQSATGLCEVAPIAQLARRSACRVQRHSLPFGSAEKAKIPS
jgi:hypothetical protein